MANPWPHIPRIDRFGQEGIATDIGLPGRCLEIGIGCKKDDRHAVPDPQLFSGLGTVRRISINAGSAGLSSAALERLLAAGHVRDDILPLLFQRLFKVHRHQSLIFSNHNSAVIHSVSPAAS